MSGPPRLGDGVLGGAASNPFLGPFPGTERTGFLIADSESIGGPALFGRKGFDVNCAFRLRRPRLIDRDGWADVALSI